MECEYVPENGNTKETIKQNKPILIRENFEVGENKKLRQNLLNHIFKIFIKCVIRKVKIKELVKPD